MQGVAYMIREGRNVINMIIPLQLGADAMILILIINVPVRLQWLIAPNISLFSSLYHN